MGAWTELQVRDRLMGQYIQTDPLHIALHRPVWTATSAGGRQQTSEEVLPRQSFLVYPFKRRLTTEFAFNPQTFGEEKVEYIHWIFIFNRGSDIEVDDFFYPEQDTDPVTDRLQSGLYSVTFLSARLWDRGQAGLLYRG